MFRRVFAESLIRHHQHIVAGMDTAAIDALKCCVGTRFYFDKFADSWQTVFCIHSFIVMATIAAQVPCQLEAG
jgi:hypothetical protein